MILPAPETEPFLRSSAVRRIWGIVLRHLYLYRESWPRLAEMMYWPLINMALFGYVSLSIVRAFGHITIVTQAYLAGVMLTEIFNRCVMGTLVMYMEEVWSRNLGHLFASPLRLRDYVTGLVGLCSVRCLISVIPAFIVVYYLFDFSILSLGWVLTLYAALLCLNGWWYGLLIISLLLRFGLAAEWLGWMCASLLLPFMAPYYPVSVLPEALQAISWSLPGTYVFECMKHQIATGVLRYDYLAVSLALNLVFFVVSVFIFKRAFEFARNHGGLLQMGE